MGGKEKGKFEFFSYIPFFVLEGKVGLRRTPAQQCERSHGVMVSTQDSESCDPSSNLGGTLTIFIYFILFYVV